MGTILLVHSSNRKYVLTEGAVLNNGVMQDTAAIFKLESSMHFLNILKERKNEKCSFLAQGENQQNKAFIEVISSPVCQSIC